MTSSRRELDEGRVLSPQLGAADATNPVPFGPWLQGRLVANRQRSAATTLEQSTSPDWHMGRWSCDRSYRRSRPEEPHALGHGRGSRGPWVPFEWIATNEVRARPAGMRSKDSRECSLRPRPRIATQRARRSHPPCTGARRAAGWHLRWLPAHRVGACAQRPRSEERRTPGVGP
jgi:hypothetical protein